jgi:poly(3-hydroxybutyrate) depolymerase
MKYYVSLPAGWSADRRWPVVVAISGSGKNWMGTVTEFTQERDKRRYPFIIATPIITSSGARDQRTNPAYPYTPAEWDRVEREGRCGFDEDGIRAVVADVARQYQGDSLAFLTGFSGGGHVTIANTVLHPETLRASAIAASNFAERCLTITTEAPGDVLPPQTFSTAPERRTLPVRFFNGEEDSNNKNLLPQRDKAMAFAREHGFDSVSSEIVRRTEHSAMPKQVLAWFADRIPANERR